MGAGASTAYGEFADADSVIAKATEIIAAYPDNRCVKYLLALKADGTLDTMPAEDLAKLFKCTKTGLENPDSGLGCYAMEPADYDHFACFFDKVRRHKKCWSLAVKE
jgi:creatine kinase